MRLGLAFLFSLPAFAQGIVGMSSNFGRSPDGSMRGSATFHIASRLPPPVINAPYSGEEVMESVQTLADGTRITRSNSGPRQKIWRDSQGRVRTEQPLGFGPIRDNTDRPMIVQISDPVAGYIYVLDNVNRVAHRVRVEARPGGPPAGMNAPPVPTAIAPTTVMRMPIPAAAGGGVIGYPGPPGGGTGAAGAGTQVPRPRLQTTTEELGTKMIDGVLVTGIKTTTIIPEGAEGNDRPMTTTNEFWTSKELRLQLLSISYSPMSGTNTRKYVNFSTAEPVASLFMPPPDYSIVDEKESFTINWGQQ